MLMVVTLVVAEEHRCMAATTSFITVSGCWPALRLHSIQFVYVGFVINAFEKCPSGELCGHLHENTAVRDSP